MIWLYNNNTETTIKMTLGEFIRKFNNGEIPDELYTIEKIEYASLSLDDRGVMH